MNENRDRIIDKVKKCLALSKSGNEHEAAAALRQAQKLMQTHGISDLDVEHANVQEEPTRAGAFLKPAQWQCALAGRVARAFDCQAIFRSNARRKIGLWVFVGVTPAGEVACYAFEVLLRQARRARAHYIKTALRRCTTTRTRRADLFCEGWVATATQSVENFAANETTQARIAAYLDHKHGARRTLEGRDRSAGRNLSEREYGDLEAGHRAGRDVQINRGLGGLGERAALPV